MVAFAVVLATGVACGGNRTTLLSPLTAEPSWRDMAFLAAVPAAAQANDGSPSLIGFDPSGPFAAEILDYARRYRPDTVYLLGATQPAALADRPCKPLPAASADEAARVLSLTFWRTADSVVLCPVEDYEAGLMASALAARLRAPLLFAAADGLSTATAKELDRLQAREVLVIGGRESIARQWKPGAASLTRLGGAKDVMAWARTRGLSIRYLAAVNPTDRDQTIVKKLSLAGALLAAGRGGLVAPLNYAARWKVPFHGEELRGPLPAGVPAAEAAPKSGRIAFDGREWAFVLAADRNGHDPRLYIDRDGNGDYKGAGEGPLRTGDAVELGGKRYAITLGAKNGAGKADLRLTWPRAEQLAGDLHAYYDALGGHPDHLCLVGFPDAIPHAIVGRGGLVDELVSDLLYANADDDPFAEIGVARIIAENASFATLLASRILTYPCLLEAKWQDRACQARWENTCTGLFENVGFEASYRHTTEDLKWIVPPSPGKRGQRAPTFGPDSPLAQCAALAHQDHSWWHELGHTFAWDADVLLAPAVVESGGCLTTALDYEPDQRSVVARLLRKGAVAFSGNSRPGCAADELQRLEFWNAMLSGQTLGESHRQAINSAVLAVLDRRQSEGGDYWYQVRIRMQFGDPAFRLHVPAKPRSAPARVSVRENVVTVHGPGQWWPVKICVPEDWKKWAGKDLYVVRGAGTYPRRGWCGEGYDREETYVSAEFTTRRRVAQIEQIDALPKPLGWQGAWYVDRNADGSRTYRWAVRLVDFDQFTGRIVHTADHVDYRVKYE